MKRTRRWFNQACLGVATAVAISACGGGSGGDSTISVGSKDFTEQLILGKCTPSCWKKTALMSNAS
jgi:osmoprotectant transport system substrate-binding protein